MIRFWRGMRLLLAIGLLFSCVEFVGLLSVAILLAILPASPLTGFLHILLHTVFAFPVAMVALAVFAIGVFADPFLARKLDFSNRNMVRTLLVETIVRSTVQRLRRLPDAEVLAEAQNLSAADRSTLLQAIQRAPRHICDRTAKARLVALLQQAIS